MPNLVTTIKRRLSALTVEGFRLLLGFNRLLFRQASYMGYDLRAELPWKTDYDQVMPVQQQPWAVDDFLFVADLIEGSRRAVPEAGEIDCSIVIPVFNKVAYTYQCFRSLLREVDLSRNEIIVVNNASSDETARVLKLFGRQIRVIDNHENKGFVEACNQGAQAAKGKYLVFLNNDTVVRPGWLKHLVETVEADPSTGAVGSMLVYPNGRLQEAGGIIWRDGRGWNYGNQRNPSHREFRYAREVDYCSAASLLVRRNIFEELGGFDRRYAPAYYEDTDLCFGVRSLGYKVTYQPASKVIHYEGATAGRVLTSGFKRFQVINHQKFVSKWSAVLQREQLACDPRSVSWAADRRRGPAIIVFDHMIPAPDRDAGSLRMHMILSMLSRWSRPVFVPVFQEISAGEEIYLEKMGVEVADLQRSAALLREREFEVAILSRPGVAHEVTQMVARLKKNTRVIFDTVDVHYMRYRREYELTGGAEAARQMVRFEALEKHLSQTCDQVWCVTTDDKNHLKSFAPEKKIKVIPTIHTLNERGQSFENRRDILFIGSFLHPPNIDAVHYFVKEILPLLRRSLPGVKFYVVGNSPPEEILAHNCDDVIVTGYVPDVDPYFHDCRIFVAPLRYGAGIKGKVGQALSYGLPVVTTSIGAEGIGLQDGDTALIRDDAPGFADAVLRLYNERSQWQTLSDKGYQLIERRYVPQAIEREVCAALNELLETGVSLHATTANSLAATN